MAALSTGYRNGKSDKMKVGVVWKCPYCGAYNDKYVDFSIVQASFDNSPRDYDVFCYRCLEEHIFTLKHTMAFQVSATASKGEKGGR